MHGHLGSIASWGSKLLLLTGYRSRYVVRVRLDWRTFERAEEDRAAFTEMANKSYKSYRALVASSRPVKRTKVSSGDVGVSPDTATARPPAKKLSSRRLDFGPSSMTQQCKESSIFIKIINITL